MQKRTKIMIATASPRMSRELKVLPLAPYALKSYTMWRLGEASRDVTIDIIVFDPDLSGAEMALELESFDVDIVAFSVYVWNYTESIACARLLGERDSSPFIIMGGPQVSPVAEEVMQAHPFIDATAFVTAPGEIIFFQFVKAFLTGTDLGTVAGLVFRDKKGRVTKTSDKVEMLDMQHPSPYLDGTVELQGDREFHVTIETSRGCPFDCAYCYWGSGTNQVLFPPLERTLAEIDWIADQSRIKHAFITDADILLKFRRNEHIADKLWSRRNTFIPEFDSDIRNIVPSRRRLIEKLHRLPGFFFKFAVQTANPIAWKLLGDNRAKPELFLEKAQLLRSWIPDAKIVADIMLPLPGDDLEGLRQTTNLVLSLEPNQIFLNYPVYLLPGTRFYDERKQLGLVYNEEPPFSILASESFPLPDIDIALKLSIWVQILTYYHPAVSHCFYQIGRTDPNRSHVNRLESWIEAIEERIQLMAPHKNLPQLAVDSVEQLNTVKGGILTQSCTVKSCVAIYETIFKLESNGFGEHMPLIELGIELFNHLDDAGVEWFDQEVLDRLSLPILSQYSTDEIQSLMPIFRRYESAASAQEAALSKLK
ncbi:MAG: radical SAM protein [Magnetococcales bacterium]|nr:radical SAM protein [Magnetococcales bacterium]